MIQDLESLFDREPQSVEVRQEDALCLLQSLPVNSVQVIFADPPYGIAYHSNHYKEKNPHSPVAQDWNFQMGAFFNVAAEALVEGGVLYLCCRWDVYPLWVQQVSPPLQIKNCVVWVKDNWSAGDLTGNFGFQHEFLLMIVKGRHTLRGQRWPNVWRFPRIPAKQMWHPTEKPVALVRRAVEASSDPGDLIVDPFCGSGTTGEAAKKRRVLLGDIDPRMVRLTCKRLGLKEPDMKGLDVKASVCPVFQVEPPSPSLWGIHPEDLAYYKNGE